MENLVFGIITLLICLAGYLEAFRMHQHKRYLLALILLIVCGFFLRLYMATDFFLHDWDERYHALVAKNLMGHPLKPTLYDTPLLPYDYRNWTCNHVWIHKPPFPLWTMALSMSLFGVNEIALRLPAVILTTIGIWINYETGTYFFNRRIGFIAAFLYSIHGLIIEVTGGRVATDHIDTFFLFFIQLAILMAIRFVQRSKAIYSILCGVSIGIAILSKWLPALIVLPIWILLVLDSKKFTTRYILIQFCLLCIVTVAVFLPWQIHVHHSFPVEAQWESQTNIRHITEELDQQGGPFYYFFDRARIIFGEIIYLPLIWFCWVSFKRRWSYKRVALLVWFMVPFLFFSFARTKMQGYILFTAPAIFIITGLFWHHLYFYRKVFRIKWMTYTILVLLLALPVRYTIERMRPFQMTERSPLWVSELKELNEKADRRKNIVVFNVPRPIETMFYLNCTAYPGIPDSTTLDSLAGTGHAVWIRDDANLPRGIEEIKGVEVVNLAVQNN